MYAFYFPGNKIYKKAKKHFKYFLKYSILIMRNSYVV